MAAWQNMTDFKMGFPQIRDSLRVHECTGTHTDGIYVQTMAENIIRSRLHFFHEATVPFYLDHSLAEFSAWFPFGETIEEPPIIIFDIFDGKNCKKNKVFHWRCFPEPIQWMMWQPAAPCLTRCDLAPKEIAGAMLPQRWRRPSNCWCWCRVLRKVATTSSASSIWSLMPLASWKTRLGYGIPL